MSATTTKPTPVAEKATKTKVEKLHGFMILASTTIGVLGALGTAFVWIAANLCVGDLEIRPDKPVESIVTKVTDKHGQQSTFYGNHVQVMPGTYHLEVGLPDKPLKHVDATVQMWKSNVIPLTIPAEFAQAPSAEEPAPKKRWWQFWKKNQSGTEISGARQES